MPMEKERYFLERVKPGVRPNIADLSNKFHAVRCNDDFIFGIGVLHASHLDTLWDHPAIFIFPSMLDRRPIQYWLELQKTPPEFLDVLKGYGVVETECGRDALVKLSDHFDTAILEFGS